MAGRVVDIPRSDAMLAALDRVLEVADEDDNAVWEEPIWEFWREFLAGCEARGTCHELTPLAAMLLLEEGLLGDKTLPVEKRINYAAAVSTIRDVVTWAGWEQARLN